MSGAASTTITHTPHTHVVPGYRVHLTALIDDPSGIVEARCYFRAEQAADYVFIVLEPGEATLYYGVLPPPAKITKNIEYVFQALNGNGEIVTTRPMTMPVREGMAPPWQADVTYDVFRLLTELEGRGGSHAPGFLEDNVMDVVHSSKRYGSVSDIYPDAKPGETTATDAGTVDVVSEAVPEQPATPAKKTGGMSTGKKVLIGGIVVGGAAGGAYALTQSGSSDSGGNPAPPAPPPPGPTPSNASVTRLTLNAHESMSSVDIFEATGTATGPSGSTFLLEAEGPFGLKQNSVTIGGAGTVTTQIDINELYHSCVTIIVRGTVKASNGQTLATRSQTFQYMCP